MVTLEILKEIVSKEISRMNFEGEHRGYRCHEIARTLKEKLESLGITTTVKDGSVVYDIPFLLKGFWIDLMDEHCPAIRRGLLVKKKICILHSWCEVGSTEEIIVIDFHGAIHFNKDISLYEVLIIDYKKNLLHQYYPTAVVFGRWIFFKTIPPHIVRVRI
jgi:hypothetical protein